MRNCLSQNPWWLNGVLSCLVLKLSYCPSAGRQGSPSFVFFFFFHSLNTNPRKWKLQFCLNRQTFQSLFTLWTQGTYSEASGLPGGDHIFCSFVNILSELCSRQISLGQILERTRFQEGLATQERASWLISIWPLFVAPRCSLSCIIRPKNDNDCFILLCMWNFFCLFPKVFKRCSILCSGNL